MTEKASEKPVEELVHVIDDQEAIRALVCRVLGTVGVRCAAWDGPGPFLSSLEGQRVDVLVVDVRLAGMSGLELVRLLRERGVYAPVVFISGLNEIAVAIEAMKLGAVDFLTKPFAGQVLIDAVQTALRRARADAGRGARVAEATSLVSRLSPREKQVFLAVIDGKPNKVVAIDLGLSEKTVEEHRSRVMAKLGAGSVADLVKLAVVAGLWDPASFPVRSRDQG